MSMALFVTRKRVQGMSVHALDLAAIGRRPVSEIKGRELGDGGTKRVAARVY